MDTKTKIARILSEILNGFITMFLPIIVATWISDIETKYKIYITIYYLVVTIVPFLILQALGKVDDYEFTDRKQRPPYFITITIGFWIGYFFIQTLEVQSLSSVSLVLAVISTILTLVTFFWKMSGHMTYGTYFLMTMLYLFPTVPFLWLILLYIPPLAWSRVQLKKHTYPQTIVGTIVPLTVSILFYCILWYNHICKI